MRRMIFVAAACLALSGCFASKDKSAAEAAVTQFHQLVDAQRFQDIYRNGANELRNATSEDEFNRTLQRVHDRLGAVAQAQEQGWEVNFNNGITRVDLNYNTRFASGSAEHFRYIVSNGVPALASYDIHSDALAGGDSTGGSDGASPGGKTEGSDAPVDTGGK
jgi:hypothetical protein